jgi:type VI secretion system secreted protein VgrG
MSDQYDFTLGWEGASGPNGPWGHLQVVQFNGHEAMSDLYRFDMILVAKVPSPEVDPQDLLHTRATLRIKTKTQPAFRVLHGIITEAQEMFQTNDGMLYRVVFRPPLARAKFRTQCRIFLDKTVRQIVDAVLQGDPNLHRDDGDTVDPDDGDTSSYTTAQEHYAWRISNSPRIDQVSSRPFCVQYNETDFAFVSRILEDEGIGFHFENGKDKCLLVLSDQDAGRSRLAPFTPIGPGLAARDVEQVQLGGRVRPQSVSLDDYNWKNPAVDMLAQASDVPPGSSAPPFFQYTYPGGYPDSPQQGQPLAEYIAERFQNEADYAAGQAKTRVLFAGCIFVMQHPKVRYDGEYLCTQVDTVGNQPGVLTTPIPGLSNTPFTSTLEALRRGKDAQVAESLFRPARSTARPKIVGSQTAFVTNDPSSQGNIVHVGDQIGCVRLKFHWDRDVVRQQKEPCSSWVRVSHYMAGAGMGAVYHPRVGDEVVVEFLEGDPDRPLVTGRVYNGARIPPAPSVGAPTISTVKTFSVPGGAQYNEYLFDDKSGSEQIFQHAAKDWNSVTEHDRSEIVKANSVSTVMMNRTESTGLNRSTTVGVNNSEAVGANESVKIGANQTITIGVNQTETIGGAQKLEVTGAQTYTLMGGQTFDITGAQTFTIDGSQSFNVTGPQTINVSATSSIHSDGAMSLTTSASQSIQAATNQVLTAGATQTLGSKNLDINASAAMKVHTGSLSESASTMTLKAGGHYTLTAGSVDISSGGTVNIHGGTIVIKGGAVSIHGSTVKVQGSPIDMAGGAAINAVAGVIKLN